MSDPETTGTIVTFTLFDVPRAKLWAFAAMGLLTPKLRRVPGLTFAKMMGAGAGIGFSARPDFSRYALFAVWNDRASADAFLASSPFIAAYRRRAETISTWFLEPTTVHGEWDGATPIEAPTEQSPPDRSAPIAVLTRATIRLRRFRRFWSMVAPVADELAAAEGRLFSIGVGEVPWIRQATISIWESREAMQRFAYRSPLHRDVIRRTRNEGWYSEEMFARFRVVETPTDRSS